MLNELKDLLRPLCSRRMLASLSAAVLLLGVSLGAAWLGNGKQPKLPTTATVTDQAQTTTSTTTTTTTTTVTYRVEITADGETHIADVLGGTVAEAIAAAGITLGEWDTLSVEGNTPIAADTAVRVTRVELEFYTQTESVAHGLKIERDKTHDWGWETVSRKGQNGEQQVTYCKRYEDGELVSTEPTAFNLTRDPIDEILVKGTKPLYNRTIEVGGITLELDEKGQPKNYKALHSGSATAYTAPAGAGTSIGMKAQEGVVAIDPDLIPYRSKLYIVSADGKFVYGYAVAGDTGGAAMNGHIVVDVFYDTYEECVMFGRRDMNVYVIG